MHQAVGSWIGEKFRLVIVVPHISSYGNAIEDYLAGLQAAQRLRRKLVIVWPFRRMLFFYNRSWVPAAFSPDFLMFDNPSVGVRYKTYLFRFIGLTFTLYFIGAHILWRVYRKLSGSPTSDTYFHPTLGQEWLWRPPGGDQFSGKVVEAMNWPEQFPQSPIVSLSRVRVERDLRSTLRAIGVPPEAWYVCVHVREGGYRSDPESPRNASPEDFFPAFEEIISRGGLVVRMGTKLMTPLPHLPGVIDYAFSDFQSTLMDAYLVSRCSFFVGTSSGPHTLALLFSKPLILTNLTNYIYGLPQNSQDLTIFQHVISKKLDKEISLREWLSLSQDIDLNTWTSPDWLFRWNSPSEIRDVVIEMLDQPKARSGIKQADFKYMQHWTVEKLLTSSAPSGGTGNEDPRFRYASNSLSWSGRIGDKYLEEHWQ